MPRSRQTKPRRAGLTTKRSAGSSGSGPSFLDDVRLDLPQQALGAQRLALVRERDEHAAALPKHPGELGLGLGEPAGGDRRPLRLERVALGVRERVELGGARRAAPARGPPPPRRGARRPAATRGRARGRRAGRGRAGTRRRRRRRARLDEVLAALGGRDRSPLVDRVERALRERRERPDLLDLVAEELDAERLAAGAREDVDEPAADGDLPALVDALGALVAGERQRLDERVEADLGADANLDRVAGARPRGGMPSASARAEAQTRPPGRGRRAPAPARRRGAPAARARSRAERRGSGGARRAPGRRTRRRPRPRRARARPRGAGRAALCRGSRGARRARSGSAGSETRAAAGKSSANARNRSLSASSVDEAVKRRNRLVHAFGGNGVPRRHRSRALPSYFGVVSLIQTSGLWSPTKPWRRWKGTLSSLGQTMSNSTSSSRAHSVVASRTRPPRRRFRCVGMVHTLSGSRSTDVPGTVVDA